MPATSSVHLSLYRLFATAMAFFIIWWCLKPPPTPPPVRALKRARAMHPHTPDHCSVCRHAAPAPSCRARYRKPGVLPWRQRKDPRGKKKTLNTTGYACYNSACDYYGNTESDFHALVGKGAHGQAERIRDGLCQACSHNHSVRLGTPLYRLRTSSTEVSRVLAAAARGLTLADLQAIFGHSDFTLRAWRTQVADHARRLHAHFAHDLRLPHVQLDELRLTLRGNADEVWGWVALDATSKFIPAFVLGPRTRRCANALIHGLCQTLASGCVPLFTSDGLDLYFYALTAHFGSWATDPLTGKSAWQVTKDLVYGQVVKHCRRRKLVRVDRRMCLGSLEQLRTTLRKLGLTGALQTAFIERLNLTLRRSIAGLARRTWATPLSMLELTEQFEWWRAWYHFCRPHASSRVKLETPRARRGCQTPQCYLARTPAMAVGLTDHVWTVTELLAFPCWSLKG